MGGHKRIGSKAASSGRTRFTDKQAAREACWELLERSGAARFPLPPRGRIPNFAGAREAAELLLARTPLSGAYHVKANPDAPQRPLRAALLQRGTTIYMPTPRLRGGFMRLDPAKIPPGERDKAAALGQAKRYADEVPLAELPQLDAVICGCVAVTEGGARCGKGEGYSDLEYALLRELGHAPAPVYTTVHDLQLVGALPTEAGDLPLHWIATPTRCIRVKRPAPAPAGIDWDRLSAERRRAMPPIDELWRAENVRRG